MNIFNPVVRLFDKFLKFLKTDRDTFMTFVLLLVTVFLLVDRCTELLLMIFTGVAYNYWGPIAYAATYLVIIFAFNFSFASKYCKSDDDKVSWLLVYCICLYVLTICMLTEWVNKLIWIDLLKPALSSIAIAIPLGTFGGFFHKMYNSVNDSQIVRDSISDYNGISIADSKNGFGAYTDEILIGEEKEHGRTMKLSEKRRFESTLVVGVSGSGKTTLIFEPWIAQDIAKKFFYKQQSKTLAYSALKAGIATLDAPYDNDYINKNFSLNMIKPAQISIQRFRINIPSS